jgi:predicted MFS family arabinose efflux permease
MKSDSLHINEDEFPEAKPRFFHGWYLVAASWIMLFLVSAVAVNIFFKPILEEFGWDRTTLSLVHTIGLLFFSLVSPFLGRLIDRFGPRVMLFICVATQTLSSVTNGLATHLWHLYIGRFLYDIKGMHASQVLINRWFVKKRGLAQGIVATGVPAGMLVLSPLSQYLVLAWGWRQTLLFWAGVTFVILLPLTVRIRENPADTGFAPDGEPLSRGTGDNRHIQPGSVASSPPDIFQESSTLGEVLRSSSLWLLLATQFICGIGCGFMMTHIVIFATDIGYSAMIGAAFLSVQGGANIIGVLLTGYVSDRLSRSRVLALTHFVRSLSFVTIALTVFYAGGSLWLLFVAMALFGFGYFTTAPLSSGLVADLFGYKRMGLLIGIILSCHMVGSALGAAAGGIIFESTGSYYPFFPIQGILEFVAAVFAFAIKRQAAR